MLNTFTDSITLLRSIALRNGSCINLLLQWLIHLYHIKIAISAVRYASYPPPPSNLMQIFEETVMRKINKYCQNLQRSRACKNNFNRRLSILKKILQDGEHLPPFRSQKILRNPNALLWDFEASTLWST